MVFSSPVSEPDDLWRAHYFDLRSGLFVPQLVTWDPETGEFTSVEGAGVQDVGRGSPPRRTDGGHAQRPQKLPCLRERGPATDPEDDLPARARRLHGQARPTDRRLPSA